MLTFSLRTAMYRISFFALAPLFFLLGCEQKPAPLVSQSGAEVTYVGIDHTLGYYSASIERENTKVKVWLHSTHAVPQSTVAIEKAFEIFAEIACDKLQIKYLKTADNEGDTIEEFNGAEWSLPSPNTETYKIIQAICR